jgi:hypothetical protein
MADPTCRSCGSVKVIPDADVFDFDNISWRPLSVTARLAAPEPVLAGLGTRETSSTPLKARVCADCGAVDLYAPDAAALWKTYSGEE